ncbi:MAG: hypothetical protein IJU44_02845 [Kiritimatiellae bacterium]|nr:hypothetical protein [Kiritimatiellia bacterium]
MKSTKAIGRILLPVALLAAGAVMGDITLTENVVLDADTDWRGQGTVTVGDGVLLDLNGHTLRVSAIAGTGSVIDSKNFEILDYVEANGTQRVVTDLIPNGNTSIDVVATPTADSPLTLFGTKTWSTYRFLCMGENNNWYFFSKGNIVTQFSANTRYRFLLSRDAATLFNDETGAQLGSVTVSFANNDNAALAICGITGGAQRGKFKMHSFKVWHEKAMRFDFVPARNPETGEVGLLNRLDGTLHVSDESTFLPGSAVGSLGVGALRVEAASDAALAGFAGTVAPTVRFVLDGSCTLAADTDWRRFGTLAIDGTVDLAGHDLSLSNLGGVGTVTDSVSIYDILDYVDATGSQIVKTGIVPSTDTGLELDMTLPAAGQQNRTVFGCKSWTTKRYLLILANNKFLFFGGNTTVCNQAAGTRYLISITPGTSPNGTANAVNVATGASLGTATVDLTNSDGTELALFDHTDDVNSERGGIYRLHSFKMTKGGSLKLDLVPARLLSTGKVGLLDRVTRKFFTSSSDTDLVAGPVATAGGSHGSLHIEVADGKRLLAESLALTGSLTLIKEGAGTLTVNRPGQTYEGGTRIASGTVDTLLCTATYPYIASNGFFGLFVTDTAVSDIVVDSGAVFDFMGNYDYRMYNIVLNGGTLRNSGHNQPPGSGSLGPLTLSADSTLDAVYNTTFYDVNPIKIDLGGYELAVSLPVVGIELYFRNAGSITNGVFWLKGNGDWRINAAVNARGTTLRAEGALWLDGHLDVENYYAACAIDSNNGSGGMNVYGRFTPSTDYFYGCTMQDGSTLDLNGREGAWSTTSAFTSGLNRVTFAEGATVTVDAHARPVWAGKIVDWGVGNKPTDVLFNLDEESKAMGRALCVLDDGLYAVGGTMIIVR